MLLPDKLRSPHPEKSGQNRTNSGGYSEPAGCRERAGNSEANERYCHRCGGSLGARRQSVCALCRFFVDRHGDQYYQGEIRAGDRFDGTNGYVWARKGTNIVLYIEAGDGGARKATLPVSEFRGRAANRVENPRGQILFPANPGANLGRNLDSPNLGEAENNPDSEVRK